MKEAALAEALMSRSPLCRSVRSGSRRGHSGWEEASDTYVWSTGRGGEEDGPRPGTLAFMNVRQYPEPDQWQRGA